MKNILWTLVLVTLTGSALAVNPSKKTLTFSTKGIDLYADGTTVLDNEQYALVYVAPDKAFGGFYTDGALVNTEDNQLLCKLPAALNGKCTEQQVQFFPNAITKKAGGKYVVVMLDTRAPDTAATGKLGNLITGWGVAGETSGVSAAMTLVGEVASQQASRASGNAQIPVDVGTPVITDIKLKEGMVVVTVRNASPKAYYSLNATDDIKKDKSLWKKSERAKHKQGVVASDTVELEYPISDSAKLFQVVIPTNAN